MRAQPKHWKIAAILLAEIVLIFGVYSVRAFTSLQKVIYGGPPPNLVVSGGWLVLLIGLPAAVLIARVWSSPRRPRLAGYAAGLALSAGAGYLGLLWGFGFWRM